MKTNEVVREVLDRIHRDRPGAEKGDRGVLLELGRSLGVKGLHPRMRVETIVARIKAHQAADSVRAPGD